MTTGVETPTVGRIVHVIKQERCLAAIIISVDDDVAALHVFLPPADLTLDPERQGFTSFQPYNSLHSARPTSGWHWPQEH